MSSFRTAAVLALLASGALSLVACGADDRSAAGAPRTTASSATSSSTSGTPVRPVERVDRLVPIDGAGGARMHLTCTGSGAKTVILVSGFGDDGSSWGAVADDLDDRARVCIPVRFGLGASDAPPEDQTFATEADDLHSLLDAAGEPGPYVVVGHSFGGAEAVAFADRHPEGVDGLLLLDASPTDWPSRACAVPDDGSEVAASFAETCSMVSDPAQNPERLDGVSAFAEVARISSLGDLRLAVVSRADVTYPGLARDAAQVLTSAWAAGQDHWAALSTDSSVVGVERTGHTIQVERPEVVVEQIDGLLS